MAPRKHYEAILHVRCTEEDKRMLDEIAATERVNPSAALRAIIRKAHAESCPRYTVRRYEYSLPAHVLEKAKDNR